MVGPTLLVIFFRNRLVVHSSVGVTSCIISPVVMKYTKPVNAAQQAAVVGLLWSDDAIAKALPVFDLKQETAELGDCQDAISRTFGMPRTLREVGFERR